MPFFPDRLAWLNRHIGDRADTAYIAVNRTWVRIVAARVGVGFIGAAASTIIYLAHPFTGALCAVWMVALIPMYGRRRMGSARAQSLVIRHLKRLPRGNTIFNELSVPGPRGTPVPISVLLVTLKGFHVIEAKHHAGVVTGDIEDSHWVVTKPGAVGSTSYRIENPVSQVKRQVHALSMHSNASLSKGRINGLVVFTHPGVELQISGADSPVRVARLEDMMQTLPKADPTGAGRRVATVLRLRRGLGPLPAGDNEAPPQV